MTFFCEGLCAYLEYIYTHQGHVPVLYVYTHIYVYIYITYMYIQQVCFHEPFHETRWRASVRGTRLFGPFETPVPHTHVHRLHELVSHSYVWVRGSFPYPFSHSYVYRMHELMSYSYVWVRGSIPHSFSHSYIAPALHTSYACVRVTFVCMSSCLIHMSVHDSLLLLTYSTSSHTFVYLMYAFVVHLYVCVRDTFICLHWCRIHMCAFMTDYCCWPTPWVCTQLYIICMHLWYKYVYSFVTHSYVCVGVAFTCVSSWLIIAHPHVWVRNLLHTNKTWVTSHDITYMNPTMCGFVTYYCCWSAPQICTRLYIICTHLWRNHTYALVSYPYARFRDSCLIRICDVWCHDSAVIVLFVCVMSWLMSYSYSQL